MKRTVSLLLALIILSLPLAYAADQALTKWRLADIYDTDEAFLADVALTSQLIDALSGFRGKLNAIDNVLAYYDAADEIATRVWMIRSYGFFPKSLDQASSAAQQRYVQAHNLLYAFEEAKAFANPELFANDDAFLDSVEADPRMAASGYLTQFKRDRELKEHTLPEAEELLLTTMHRMTDGALELYNSNTLADMVFPDVVLPDGRVLTADSIGLRVAISGGYDQSVRKEVYEAMMGVYAANRNTLAQNMHNYYTGLAGSASAHRYSSALEDSLFMSNVPIVLYESLMSAAHDSVPSNKRYVEFLKARLDLNEIYDCDIRVPIVEKPSLTFTFEEALDILPKALAPLGEEYVKALDTGLSGGWIDAYPADGKEIGAFAEQVYGVHPYVLLNYTDDYDSLSTMAHEFGHAMHMHFSDDNASYYEAVVTSVTSEVASTLNEFMLTDYLIKNAATKQEKDFYLAKELNLIYATFFRQLLYASFQEKIAARVEAGEALTADALDAIWLDEYRYFFGDTISIAQNAQAMWSYIPHFYYGFYVYQYALSVAVACDIADRIISGEEGAVESYIEFLKAGNTGDAVSMFAIAGVDATNSDFIKALVERFNSRLTELGG